MLTFGPVPSRRLGRSLGVNNIPPKICTYSCVYCQLGNTLKMRANRSEFFKPELIFEEVKNKTNRASLLGEAIDYLSFVPDGEPTLDINLGREIDLLKILGIKIAVITNSSLIWDENVRNDLYKADWVSIKIDTLDEFEWCKIDRPYGRIKFENIKNGIKEFAKNFKGDLITETMLVQGINDNIKSLKSTANFISGLKPKTAYLSIPTRPPAEKWTKPPEAKSINYAYQIFGNSISNVELLTGYEGNTFASTGDCENDLLNITSVHPMRKDAVQQFVNHADADWSTVESLLESNKIVELEYDGNKFYLRNLKNKDYN